MQKCEADEVKSDDVTVEQTAEIVCPRVNCPEKIVSSNNDETVTSSKNKKIEHGPKVHEI